MSALRRLAPAAVLLLSGCLATKSDLVFLQSQLHSMQDASTRADTARSAQIDRVLAQVLQNNDSMRAVSARLAKLQSAVATDHYEMGRQILQIQELSGQSQRRLQELRASLEERSQAAAVAPAPVPGAAAPAPAGPGPAQLFQTSLDQLRRGSSTIARSGFEELLRTYPQSDDAPEAMIYIGETYAAERNQVAADSVYAQVVERYPTSPKAATALYKRALSFRAAGRTTAARAAFDRIVKEYPRSDEASLAREQLRTLGTR
ncbi:MAG: Tetratricopeptide repeat-containing protein [Gemmatimonadetes bacterium]|nr:Tetratricopeptide repeat-containing protein [Gemmatimonadota bacterium]